MTNITRRDLTKISLASGIVAMLPSGMARAMRGLPAPDFSLDGYPRYVAGLRPYRDGTFRLESEVIGERLLVQNYGHGGSGITVSWGVALEVLDMVRAHVSGGPVGAAPKVAVLGAGVIGLTSATILREAGFDVTVLAKGFLEETTSSVAGGQFAPSTIAVGADSASSERFRRILRRSFRRHEAKLGLGFGVYRRPNYATKRSRSLDLIPRDVVPEPQYFSALPFPGHENQPGYCYDTLLIEPPVFLRRLEIDLRLAGVRLIRNEFLSLDHILATLDHGIIVNCLGLGAGVVMDDPAVVPVRGQLVLLKPQPHLEYLYVGNGYIFPRSDSVVVGGTYERGVTDPTPVPQMCEEILAQAKAPFFGEAESLGPAPDWMVDHT